MRTWLGRLAAVAAVGVIVPVLGVVGPADAACSTSFGKWTSYNVADSTKFDASSGCNGVWGVRAAQLDDPVRGRFLKDGAWQVSAYGWAWVYTGADNDNPRIVGDTIDGRDIKGQSFTYAQVIYYKY